MNWYEHHIGDYAEATAHLSFVEDAAYSRMIRKYYSIERPLPSDVKAIQRLIAARTREERDAVQIILDEFFTLQGDGWHNKRCDEVLAEYHDGAQDRELKKGNERDRKRRSRERRKALFDELREHGIVPKWSATTDELEQHLSRVTGRDSHAHVTPESRDLSRGQDADGTASHFPLPTSHSPVSEQSSSCIPTSPQANPPPDTHALDPEPDGFGSRVMDAYPPCSHKDWISALNACRRLVREGEATWDELAQSVERYAAYVKAGGVSGPQFVRNPARFFGDASKHWAQTWEYQAPKPAKPGKSAESADAWRQVVEAVRHGRYRKPGFTLGDHIDATVRLLGSYVRLAETDDFGLRQAEKQFHEHFASRAA